VEAIAAEAIMAEVIRAEAIPAEVMRVRTIPAGTGVATAMPAGGILGTMAPVTTILQVGISRRARPISMDSRTTVSTWRPSMYRKTLEFLWKISAPKSLVDIRVRWAKRFKN